jgi:hypothetical protein
MGGRKSVKELRRENAPASHNVNLEASNKPKQNSASKPSSAHEE